MVMNWKGVMLIVSVIIFGTHLSMAPCFGQVRDGDPDNRIHLPKSDGVHQGEISEIDGHTFLSASQLEVGSGPSLFERLSQERRWDSDLLRVLEDKLLLLQAQIPQHKEPAPVQRISQTEYNKQANQIEAQISYDRAVQDDARRSEDEKAKAQLDLIDQTRHKAQLNIQYDETTDYDKQRKEYDDFQHDLSNTRLDYAAAQHYLSMIDDAIAKALDASQADNSFRMIMGGAFTFLVASLIIGFFWIALKDEAPRRMFLTQDRGLQFITLFSLVIAIVLFGVMNILEGKELSALLGGLSGYILGRSNLGQDGRQSAAVTQRGAGASEQEAKNE